ncbi:MAG: L-fuculose-phosphate aldolase [Eubacteriaceae bacterium]|jgi:L-fuculose-phosphate aldolase|nr:L-fuculose-phosphate aldolase [Eubacteriaceae bacterium]MDK2905426.1 L-fuculose-phosphate aldolase [Eubacteriaceae bacterium]MDK2962506.1 L-fuculose-phosphate aldolase [Eubacteriaceae bacterium]
MILRKEREDVVHYCRKLVETGLTKGTGGNISILNRQKGLMAISPSGMDYFETEAEDVVVLDVKDGGIVDGKRKPSSERELHRIFYVKRDDINAVVHTHSVYATVLATLREGLPASSYLIALAGLDVRCADYATFGTTELAELTFAAMIDRYAVLMANHGLLTGSKDILNAFNIAEEIEYCAEVYVKARSIGTPVILDETEMTKMIQIFNKSYGQKVAKADMD